MCPFQGDHEEICHSASVYGICKYYLPSILEIHNVYQTLHKLDSISCQWSSSCNQILAQILNDACCRGTEYLQSPEMLEVSSKAPQDFDRRRVVGAGSPTDVWGLGCLLYELITGSMLQYDTDWMRFYVRVVQDKMPIIEESKARCSRSSSPGALANESFLQAPSPNIKCVEKVCYSPYAQFLLLYCEYKLSHTICSMDLEGSIGMTLVSLDSVYAPHNKLHRFFSGLLMKVADQPFSVSSSSYW